MSTRGHNRERQIRRLLEDAGWFVIRAPGSLGVADLVALKAGETPRLVESKSTLSPYSHFGPADRSALSAAARKAGAIAELAWWPSRGALRWIPEAAWPLAQANETRREQ